MSSPFTPSYASHGHGQLSEHVQKCLQAQGPWHRMHCAGEAVHGFLAGRFVTTVVVMTTLVAVIL